MEKTKTSEEWCKEYSIELWEDILDPDGWNRDNFQNSFYNEKIRLYEFANRILASTCNIRTETNNKWGYWFVGQLSI